MPKGQRGRTPCTFPECDQLSRARGLCNSHYEQQRSSGELVPLYSRARKIRATLERNERGEKYCIICRNWQVETEFHRTKNTADRLTPQCRKCISMSRRAKNFNISVEDIEWLMDSQGGRCAICRCDLSREPRWQIDHDHACCPVGGRSCGSCVRGILCRACNHGLGNVKDSAETLASMIAYLEEGALPIHGRSTVKLKSPTRTRAAA